MLEFPMLADTDITVFNGYLMDLSEIASVQTCDASIARTCILDIQKYEFCIITNSKDMMIISIRHNNRL